MIRVLITGADSYLGNNTKAYLESKSGYLVDTLDMLDENWIQSDFSKYDVVFNVCAIVHRFNKVDDSLYFRVNRDLAIQIAKKAKDEGVRQFIQTSSNGVFGLDYGVMSVDKGFNPRTSYEKSKYEADCVLEELRDEHFKVCIVRPPLMYGNGCKGNFPKMERFAINHRFFPSLNNKKDFIYIENMADFVKFSIDNELDEICYPRDKEVVAVSTMIQQIACLNGNTIHLLGVFNPFVKILYRFSHSLRLVFGDCYCTEAICSKEWVAPYSIKDALHKMYKKDDGV